MMLSDPILTDVTTRHRAVAAALRALGYDARTRPSTPGQVVVVVPQGIWHFEDDEVPPGDYIETGFFRATGTPENDWDSSVSVPLPRHDGEEPEGARPGERTSAILTILLNHPVENDGTTKEVAPVPADTNPEMDTRVRAVRAMSDFLKTNPPPELLAFVTRPTAEYRRCGVIEGRVRCSNDAWIEIERDSYQRAYPYCRDHAFRGLTRAEEAVDLDNYEATIRYLVQCQKCARPEVLLPFYDQMMIGYGWPCVACIDGTEGYDTAEVV